MENNKTKLLLEIVEKINTLALAAFGLVAALAWNDAIGAIFKIYFPSPEEGVGPRIGYALAVTVVVVLVTMLLAKWVNKLKARVSSDEPK